MPAFPIAKLVGIVIKQMGKPLANFAKERAKNNHFFRTYVCMPPAQLYHWCEVRMKMYVMNIGRSGEQSTIPKLNEQAAIELGASLLGEGVIFLVAVSALGYEYGRQKTNEKNKEIAEYEHLANLENKVNDLVSANKNFERDLKKIRSSLNNLEKNQNKLKQKLSNQNNSLQSKGKIDSAIEDVRSSMRTK